MFSYLIKSIVQPLDKFAAIVAPLRSPLISPLLVALVILNLGMICTPVVAQSYPAPVSGVWSIKDFKFHTGEVLSELKIGYMTIGSPSGLPVVLLHGTTSSSQSMLAPSIAGELFGPGQPLDANKYLLFCLTQ